jgi:hypothetical protein
MREMYDDTHDELNIHPVAVFTDLETAEGNAEGYNLSMEEQKLDIHFHVTTTMLYE